MTLALMALVAGGCGTADEDPTSRTLKIYVSQPLKGDRGGEDMVRAVARKVVGEDVVPTLSPELPGGGPARHPHHAPKPEIVFMPACVGTMFGSDHACGKGSSDAFRRLCELVGIRMEIPDDIQSLCCGTPWKSKGMKSGAKLMGERLAASLAKASNNWELPIVCDAVSCTEGMQVALKNQGVTDAKIIDAVQFTAEQIAPKLPQLPREHLAVLHPTCSSTHLGVNDALIMLAGLVADEVMVPDGWRCCAFAGDRGLLHPELTATSTRDEAAEAKAANADLYMSLNRTCELGLTRATGKTYVHVLEELASRAAPVNA